MQTNFESNRREENFPKHNGRLVTHREGRMNATNHANFANPQADVSNNTFGFITGTTGPNQSRQWRFGARFSF